MRVILVPSSTEGWLLVLIALGVIIAIAIAVAAWQGLFPSATKKVLKDGRYHEALAVYTQHLGPDEPTLDDRRDAFAAATEYLVKQHGIASEQAAPNMRLMVAAFDRDQSFDLRNDAAIFEEA